MREREVRGQRMVEKNGKWSNKWEDENDKWKRGMREEGRARKSDKKNARGAENN